MSEQTPEMRCPKCLARSGDDWEQCGGSCPMPGSPHYDADYSPQMSEQTSRDEKIEEVAQ